MAVDTVADPVDRFELKHVNEALRLASQAMAILRTVWLAVEAQEDGAVSYADNKFSRWGPAVDAACSRVCSVRDLLISNANSPYTVNWWTSLNLLEALGAALWQSGTGTNKYGLESDELQSCARAAIDSLGEMYEELESAYSALETEAIEEGFRD